MAKKAPTPVSPPVAKPVIAVEFDGKLYPSFQKAEGARAKSDLMTLLVPPRETFIADMYSTSRRMGIEEGIDGIMKNAELIHAILSRYLDAAKIETPTAIS